MRIAYFDCSAGISGDMILGALLDAGYRLSTLRQALKAVDLPPYRLRTERVSRGGLAATRLHVRPVGKAPARTWKALDRLLARSRLAASAKARSRDVLRRLGEAEAKVHGIPLDNVHFHEVGAVDTLVDIVGAASATEALGIEQVQASAVNVGSGWVACEHGLLPVPAPATVELLRGVPVYGSEPAVECATPTGAALLATLAQGFGPMPSMRVAAVGHGAGSRDLRERPNVLRVFIGDLEEAGGQDYVTVLQTTLDDLQPQVYEYLMERLLEAGALEVTLTPAMAKKNRPAVVVTVLGAPGTHTPLADILLEETTTLGVRIQTVARRILPRETATLETPYGPIRVKVARRGRRVIRAMPEYEDCKAAARRRRVPLLRVLETVKRLAQERLES